MIVWIRTLALALLIGLAAPGLSPAQQEGHVPGGSLGNRSDAEFWQAIRLGEPGRVSIPDPQAGVMIQSEGEAWRSLRNGPLTVGGLWLLGGMVVALMLFYLVRGRIRIDSGRSGVMVQKFNGFERFAHWLLASSFIVLALTGLNLLYGRYVLLPLIGPEYFAALTQIGKYIHNYSGFVFISGLVLTTIVWAPFNIFRWRDWVWLSMAGGFLKRNVHPPAKRFNGGQKILFWLVTWAGVGLATTGVVLLIPDSMPLFSTVFHGVNTVVGTALPTDLTPFQEAQLAELVHATIALLAIALVLAHTYIGTIGMQGAFGAVSSGMVDLNWAIEHHGLWVADLRRRGKLPPEPQPAPADPAAPITQT